MCFTNLPVEFDEDGNPHLADDADAVEHRGVEADGGTGDEADGGTGDEAGEGDPTETTGRDLERIGCLDDDPGVLLEELDPDETYEAVVETLPETAREVVGENDPDDARLPGGRDGRVDSDEEHRGRMDHSPDGTTRVPAVIE